MVLKDTYPCYRKEIEKLLNETNYFSKKENSWRNIMHINYCSFMTKNGSVCCTKIKDKGQIYCKHHRHKEFFILCTYNNCKNKCRVFGDFCHKHKKYGYNNINVIADDVFKYNIFKKYNTVNDWERYIKWYTNKNEDILNTKKITIIEYKTYTNCIQNSPVVKYFDYRKYIIKILFDIHKQLNLYCIKNKINLQYCYHLLYMFYKFYQSSYFKQFSKNKKYNSCIKLDNIIIKDKYIYSNINKNKKLICYYTNDVLYKNNDISSTMDKNKEKKKKKKKNKSIEQLYNIFNDKIKNFISYGKKSKQESKTLKKIINDNLNKYKTKYNNNINSYIYVSSIKIFDEIEKYIEQEVFHDIQFFDNMLRNVFINYKVFVLFVKDGSTNEEKEKWKPRIEEYIFNRLKNF